MLEEDAFFDGKVCEYIDPRQTEMIEIDWDKWVKTILIQIYLIVDFF